MSMIVGNGVYQLKLDDVVIYETVLTEPIAYNNVIITHLCFYFTKGFLR